ncbi:MAG TPA: outer membrane protein transport protein [Deltaproteobacteria bacterium]|nr:outer membrane protein transport protein [Deltaproteobacteria bacterium]
MKRFSIISGVLAFLFLLAGQSYAQIDNLTNMSAEWVRMSNRNAATDAADIVVYNPAGLVSLSDGFHLNFSNQILVRKPEHSFTSPLTGERVSYEQDSPDWFVPNLYAAYTKGKLSIFAGVYIPGSAGSIDYPDGSITTEVLGANLFLNPEINLGVDPTTGMGGIFSGVTEQHLKGTSVYLASSIGAAYEVTDMISLAAAVRNIYVNNKIKGGLTLTGTPGIVDDTILKVHVEQEDNGWGGVLGIQIRPDDKLNLALRYESPVKLNLETDIRDSDNISEMAGLYTDGERNRRDFPGMVGAGVSYRFTPEFRGELDANYWFQKEANWGKSDGRDIAHMAGDCWSVGVAGVYQASPKLEVSSGILYTIFRWDDMDAYYLASPGAVEIQYSDNLSLGLGLGYKVIPSLKLNLGANYTWWKDESIEVPGIGKVNMDNSSLIIAFGFDYSM